MIHKLKSSLAVLILVFAVFSCNNEPKSIKDESAIIAMKKMADTFHGLESVSFKMDITEDVLDYSKDVLGVQTKQIESKVKAVYPDKLYIVKTGDNENKKYWFDGNFFTYYSEDENNYITLEFEGTIENMIHEMHEKYGFKFTAGDFFYPQFSNDVVDFFDSIEDKGIEQIEGEECAYITAKNDSISLELWVSNKTFLPKKYKTKHTERDQKLKYEAKFTDWKTNPTLNDSIFQFSIPESAHLINIMSKQS